MVGKKAYENGDGARFVNLVGEEAQKDDTVEDYVGEDGKVHYNLKRSNLPESVMKRIITKWNKKTQEDE